MERDWKRLASYARNERVRLGYPTRNRFAAAHADGPTRISLRTLGTIERGQEVKANTLATLEVLFGWTAGSAEKILCGGEPDYREEGSTKPPLFRSFVRDGIEIGDLIAWVENNLPGEEHSEARALILAKLLGEEADLPGSPGEQRGLAQRTSA